jgi:aryl-alcohol dehydrogenase-like predicted oxidoreductase
VGPYYLTVLINLLGPVKRVTGSARISFSERVTTKAGWPMWPGPYGDWGSRKYLVASLDQSLKQMELGYVDIFFHHRPDPETPLEETMGALDHIVRQGKALYVGISSYTPEQTRRAAHILRKEEARFWQSRRVAKWV